MNFTAINYPPVNTVPGAQGAVGDAAPAFSTENGNPITVSAPDVGVGVVTVTLSVATAPSPSSNPPGWSVTGNGTPTLTLTGTVAR